MNVVNKPLSRRGSDFSQPVAERTIGMLLVEAGKIGAEDAERILLHQKLRSIRFGEAAIELGLVEAEDIRQVLAKQFQYPYLRTGESAFTDRLIAAYQPFSPEVEALRALRSQLMLRWFSASRRGLAVVGVGAGSGAAAMLAANLAVVFSQLGEQTLLMDCDLRAPSAHDTFRLGGRPGLSDVLGRRHAGDAIQRIAPFVDLSVLPSGTQAPNPLELLNRSSFQELCVQVMSRFDVVLCTTPPTAVGSDCFTIASRVGAALLVATRNATRQSDLHAAAAQLRQGGVTLVGSVLAEA
ncbi:MULTISPECIES: chain length determinant protein tyrosine kinase EpsG [Massilia]|uniref:Chain length determinant protein tyrosine kinase EpsG n=1 Tax=Massilia haematophila TaxID=457923 RepID=A0ABV7PGZ3_9BURK|nr:chain length determinant protein tyrosine kinase EpsG [Massilia sp.]HBZ06411.1 chain length determinant protein tyrosine kinase EpsG [Massilia sp.]